MKTYMTKEKAEGMLLDACGSREAFQELINVSRNYDVLTPEQKEVLSFLRKCYREEKYLIERAAGYVLRNYDINYDYLIKHFKL